MQQEFLLTRSNYYSQFFNTAVFFDPFRIYFNSAYESMALNLYYHIQQHFKDSEALGTSCYILMYPDAKLFEKSFGVVKENIVVAREGDDIIIGLKSTSEFENYQAIIEQIEQAR